jgi:hypothetical protein
MNRSGRFKSFKFLEQWDAKKLLKVFFPLTGED